MSEDLNQQDREELELYRQILAESQLKKKNWQDTLCQYLGKFIGYSCVVAVLWVCWNWSLVKLWPQIPEITPLQMAGLWYLISVLTKRA